MKGFGHLTGPDWSAYASENRANTISQIGPVLQRYGLGHLLDFVVADAVTKDDVIDLELLMRKIADDHRGVKDVLDSELRGVCPEYGDWLDECIVRGGSMKDLDVINSWEPRKPMSRPKSDRLKEATRARVAALYSAQQSREAENDNK